MKHLNISSHICSLALSLFVTIQSEATSASSSSLVLDSKLRLVCSRTLVLQSIHKDKVSSGDKDTISLDELLIKQYPGPCLTGISFYPNNPNNFLTHHSDGRLIHESRFGITTPPHTFHQTDLSSGDDFSSGDSNQSKVTCIDFSPFCDGIFLVGYNNGNVRLYHNSSSEPRACWEAHCFSDQDPSSSKSSAFGFLDHRSIIKVFFSPHRACVFYVCDSENCLHVFDLLKNEALPLLSERVDDGRGASLTQESKSESKSEEHSVAIPCSFALSQFTSTSSLLAVTVNGELKFRPVIPSLTLHVDNEQTLMHELLDSLL